MKLVLAVAVSLVAISVARPEVAGKVNIPKEGPFEFDFCAVGSGEAMSLGDKVTVSHYRNVANLRTEPAGRPFDRMGATCLGTFANINGKIQEFGVCELTDMDGDKWFLQYQGGAEGTGGTYTAPHGTGKYEGMTLKGQYVLDFWPAAIKDGFQGCFHNKGTYKLK